MEKGKKTSEQRVLNWFSDKVRSTLDTNKSWQENCASSLSLARVETSFHVMGNAHPADPLVEDLTDGGVPGIGSARNDTMLSSFQGENVSGKSVALFERKGVCRTKRPHREKRSIDRSEIEARNDLLSRCSNRRIACKQRS